MPYAKNHVDSTTIRRVWAAMSRNPQRSKALLMRQLRLSRPTLYAALYQLREAGYIEMPEHGAVRIVVPFVVQPLQIHKP